jgi:hypothetical protein
VQPYLNSKIVVKIKMPLSFPLHSLVVTEKQLLDLPKLATAEGRRHNYTNMPSGHAQWKSATLL